MDYEYLKSDRKRIEKKLDELNQKYMDIQHQNEINKIEERCNEISSHQGEDIKAKIWKDIYSDVLEIEKNVDFKKEYEKEKQKDKKKKKK